LINAVGDEGAERVSFTSEDLLADFRISLQRSEPEKELLIQGNALAIQLLQMGMLDENTISKILNLATPAEVYSAARRYLKMKQEIARQQEEAMAAQGMQMEAQAQQQQIDNQLMQLAQMENANQNMADNRDAKLMETMMKAEAQMASRQQPRGGGSTPNQVM
jgi:lysyl-tRNA synthetase class I